MDSRKCQTAAVSPAEPGVYPLLIISIVKQRVIINLEREESRPKVADPGLLPSRQRLNP